ncbi:MAG: hypothetical protein IKG85_07340 [Clostridia bacterium]|nr:hypothetical protein [Clostridia bacterium]
MNPESIINIIVAVLSFVLAAISVITVIITLRQNKKQLESNERQIEEMRSEHQLSLQPVLVVKDINFRIERPRFFYAPPFDRYSFQSRYYCEGEIINYSNATAVCVDTVAKLKVEKDGDHYSMLTLSNRNNVVTADGGKASYHEMIAGDNVSFFYDSIRANSAECLPRIKIMTTYKNTCGGYFLCKQSFILMPNDTDEEELQKWHTCISSASVQYKRELDVLKTMQHDIKWHNLFDAVKKDFDTSLGDKEIIKITCREIAEEFEFRVISADEYREYSDSYGYPQYVHHTTSCAKEVYRTNGKML